ncbi:response regulator [Janthinobacterium aquaticum]|uniref:response regulator n=1 Tax=Janthinobacterium sp. FT58W TaxID=2654254 RepID=UPI0012651A6E|nr:response regulator [Janthinobacterium sp. FT58W]KAB8041640.1 response regulator [Janthinobacterium sp. FT58W]
MQFDSRATVLYVDDEAMARKYFEQAVSSRYRVLTAVGVTAALAVLAVPGQRVDVLVTDYRMPERLGSELLQEVASRYPHIVCLMLTAYADKQVLLELINAGTPFRLLEKPLDTATLLVALQQAAQAGRQRAARRQGLMAIDESLAFLAHELNAPLAAMANFARGIEHRAASSSPLEAEIGEAAALMHGHARYCLSLLARFVDTVRLAGNGLGLQAGAAGEAASASQLLAQVLDSYPMSAAQRAAVQVRVTQDFAVTESPNCVALILSCVLGHALQAVQGESAPALLFTIDGARMTLCHNGGGMEPATVRRMLADPHGDGADGEDEDDEQAAGLVFCQRMMQSFGGAIDIGGEPGLSTCISLHFPLQCSAPDSVHDNSHDSVTNFPAQPRSEHD